jgi:hypothetical protein
MAANANLEKTCSCGHTRTHSLVERKSRYTFWRTIGLYTGISVKPFRVDYQCGRCKEILDSTTDPAELGKYIM